LKAQHEDAGDCGGVGVSGDEFKRVAFAQHVMGDAEASVGKLPTSYDASYAGIVNGVLDIAVSKHIWIRAVQADYFYFELRSLQGDRQNQLRIGTGVLSADPTFTGNIESVLLFEAACS
jgi:hypothetical protein